MDEFVKSLKEHFSVDILELIKQFLPVVLTFIVCILAIKVIMKLVTRFIEKSKLEKSLHTFLENVIKVILYFIMILIIADMLNIPITSLIATFSVVGLAFSLAIQDALSNLASGVMILATHPFKSGDYISAGSTNGTVKLINFSHTILVTPDNKIIHVPNKEIINSTITNYSEKSKRRVDITFNLSYNADANLVKEIIKKRISEDDRILQNEEVFVRTTAFQASGIDYTLRVWVKNSDYWNVYFDLLEGLKQDFDANGIEIPYNQLDVNIKRS